MSVVITEITLFLVFAAIVGLATGYWLRPRGRGQSAAVARERLAPPAPAAPVDNRAVEALQTELDAARSAHADADASLRRHADEAAELRTALAATRAELSGVRGELSQARDALGKATAQQALQAQSEDQHDALRDQLLAAQAESARLRLALQRVEADLEAQLAAAAASAAAADDDESATIQLEEPSAPPDPRALRMLSQEPLSGPTMADFSAFSVVDEEAPAGPDAWEAQSEARRLRSAESDASAAIAARDHMRRERDRLREELVQLRATHSDLQSLADQRARSRADLDDALAEARQRLERAEGENTELRGQLLAAETRVDEISRSVAPARNPLTVRFLPLTGPIGADAREARVRLVLDMAPGTPWALRARRVQVTLDFDLDDANIAINGRRTGPLVLAQDAELRPDSPMGIDLRVSTGAFSASVSQHRSSTPLGEHPVRVTVQFQLEPEGGRAGRAIARLAMPIVAG